MTMFSESLRAFLSPVAEYLDDVTVSEILINGPDSIWIERRGRLELTSARFTEDGLLAAARNMAQYVGRPLTEEQPRLDARLPDGSRIHVVLAPMARCGTVVSIRKFYPGGLKIEDMVKFGTITPEAGRFLEVLVLSKKNVMVAGGTGSGKTTLLNVLSRFIPDEERILTIEDSAELQLHQQHLVTLESRPPDHKGRYAVTIRDLLHSALRLRPDRIVIGEVRGSECFDLLQAMNTGHGGMLSTIHANSPLETLNRIESLALLADIGLPLRAVRAQVSSAVNAVVCTARLRDGSRKLTAISEVLPLDNKGDYRVQDIFVFSQTRSARGGAVKGYLSPTGVIPTFQSQLIADGFEDMQAPFFSPSAYGYPPPKHFLGAPSADADQRDKGVAPPAAAPAPAAAPTPAAVPTSRRVPDAPRHHDAGRDPLEGTLEEPRIQQPPRSRNRPLQRVERPEEVPQGKRQAGQYTRGEPRPRRARGAHQSPPPRDARHNRDPEHATQFDVEIPAEHGYDPELDEGEPTHARARRKR